MFDLPSDTFETEHFTVIIIPGISDPKNDTVDVEIRLKTGERYIPTFYTVNNIRALLRERKDAGDDKGSLYFPGAGDTIIVEEMTEKSIVEVVEYMYQNNELGWLKLYPYEDDC